MLYSWLVKLMFGLPALWFYHALDGVFLFFFSQIDVFSALDLPQTDLFLAHQPSGDNLGFVLIGLDEPPKAPL